MLYTQYTNAINLQGILYGGNKSKITNLPYRGMTQYLTIDPNDFLETYFSLSDTTSTEGLNNWGRILNVTRTVQIPNVTTNSIFGFDTGVPPSPIDTGYPQNFGEITGTDPETWTGGNFYGGDTTLYRFTDEEYLFLLQLRYAVLNTNCSLAAANAILNTYFKTTDPTQQVTVTDNGPMKMLISVLNPVPVYQLYILSYRPDVLPIPAAIEYSVNATYL